MQSFGSVFSSFNEMAAGTGALSQQIQSQMSVFNAPKYWYADGSGVGLDFYMESYAGDDEERFPGVPACTKENGSDFTPDDRKTLLQKHGTTGVSKKPFYGIEKGVVHQYNPDLGEFGMIELGKVGDVNPYGDKLPDGWDNFADFL